MARQHSPNLEKPFVVRLDSQAPSFIFIFDPFIVPCVSLAGEQAAATPASLGIPCFDSLEQRNHDGIWSY